MSYKEVQRIYKEQFGKTAKSSWIAQIKSENGKTSGPSPNRDGDYKHPCPDSERKRLTKVLKNLRMI